MYIYYNYYIDLLFKFIINLYKFKSMLKIYIINIIIIIKNSYINMNIYIYFLFIFIKIISLILFYFNYYYLYYFNLNEKFLAKIQKRKGPNYYWNFWNITTNS
jgi:hypothetical protein